MATPQARGAALRQLFKEQYEGTDATSMEDFLKEGKLVPLLPGQERTIDPDEATAEFEQRLAQIEKKRGSAGARRGDEQKKYLRRVASFYFNSYKWSSSSISIDDAIADLVRVGAVVDPWFDENGQRHRDFKGFRRIGSVAEQDNRDNSNNDRYEIKIKRLEKRERNPRPGKKPSNEPSATRKWGEESLIVGNAQSEGVEVPVVRAKKDRAHLLYTGRGPRGDRRQPLRAENVECDSCTRNVSDGFGKVYSPHNHITFVLLSGGQVICKICDKGPRVITDDLVAAGVEEDEMQLVAETWLYALKRSRLCDDGEAKDIFDEAIEASYAATVNCKKVSEREQQLAELAWAEQDPSQRAASRRRRAMSGVFEGDDDDAEESEADDASARGAVSALSPPPRSPPPSSSRAPSPPQTPSSQPPPQELVSSLSVRSVSSRQSIGTLRERLRERARAARKRRRSSSRASPSPLKRRRRGADADADALVVGAGHEIVRVCSMLSKIARSGSSSSAEAGAALASLKLFLTEV